MLPSSFFLALAFTGLGIAPIAACHRGHPKDLPGDAHVWQKPGKSDMRSPCPALNTVANIGVLPRNGQNITSDMLAKAVTNVYNVDPSFAKTLAESGFSGVAAKGAAFITLADLSKHDVIEHDASLVRNDAKQGDNHSVQPALVKALLADATGDFVTMTSIARTRSRREKESKAAGSPALSAKSMTLAYGEAALLLQTLGGNQPKLSGWNAPKQAVAEWLGEEKLPTGFVKPKTAITAGATTLLAGEILALAKTLY